MYLHVNDARNDVIKLRILQTLVAQGYSTSPQGTRRLRRINELRTNLALKNRLRECETGRGTVFVHRHGMDCDHSTFSSLTELPSDYILFQQACDQAYEYADGPLSLDILTLTQAQAFEPEASRDLALEAMEEGRPHFIHAPC